MRNQIIYLSVLALLFLTFVIRGSDTKSDSSDIESGPQALVPGVDYVPGEVIITITPTHMPSKSEVSFSPPSLGIAELDSIFEFYGGIKLRKLTQSYNRYVSDSARRLERTFLFHYQNDMDAQDLAAILFQFPYIESATVNRILHIQFYGTKRLEPEDTTLFSLQWYFDNDYEGDMSDIDMPEAWAIEKGHPDTIIAIFDEGTMVDTCTNESGWKLHSDLNYHFNDAEDHGAEGILNGDDLNGYDDDGDGYKDNTIGINLAKGCVNDPPLIECGEGNEAFWYAVPHDWVLIKGYVPDSLQGELLCPDPIKWEPAGWSWHRHGIGVASIAAGKLDGSDIVGAAHNCKVFFARIPCDVTVFELTQAIEYLSKDASVINCSWGTYEDPDYLEEAVDAATNAINDCVIVAATGNDYKDDQIGYPAAYDKVLAVGAITRGNGSVPVKTGYSNYDKDEELVDVVAPVSSGVIKDSYTGCTGTGCVSGQTYPCDIEEDSLTYWGTSFAAPQAAGLAALIRSRFLNLNESQVRQRIKKSAEYYWDSDENGRYKYGAGKINAYRALTEWDTIKVDTTWDASYTRDGKYYVSGDLIIDEGVTLTINKGTIVKIAPDHEQAGPDPNRVQIIVRGTLQTGSSGSGSIVFESFTDSPPTKQDWVGIKFDSTSQNNKLEDVVIKNAQVGIWNYAPLEIDGCSISVCTEGIKSFNSLWVKNTTISDANAYGIMLEKGVAVIDKVDISNCGIGINLQGNYQTSLTCSGSYIHNIETHGVSASSSNSSLTLQNTLIDSTYFGVTLLSVSNAEIDNCLIKNSDSGIFLLWSSGPEVKSCVIDSNTTNGIYCLTSDIVVRADTIMNSAIGVYCLTNSDPSIKDSTVIKDNTDGIKCEGNSDPTVRTTKVAFNSTTGVLALNGSNPDLGHACGDSCVGASCQHEGRNSIHHNSSYDVDNRTDSTIVAECNFWRTAPPNPNKFNGPVDYLPCLGQDPLPVAGGSTEGEGAQGEGGEITKEEDTKLPLKYELSYNYPNPFNPVTTLRYDVPSPGSVVSIVIYNIKGQAVKRLMNQYKAPGFHSIAWNGKDDRGESVASGIYFVQMKAEGFRQTRKLVLLK